MPAQKLDRQHSLKILNMEPTGISTNSHQQLMGGSDDCESNNSATIAAAASPSTVAASGRTLRDIRPREWITVMVLCFVNLINYMDRFTIPGVLTDIQKYFGIGDDLGGLLQTVFILSYMLCAPIFGYLGDRYNRRYIMAFGVCLWSLTTLIGSFMESFTGFILFRALVGIGEASYSTIAPTIISDMFVKNLRSIMLALFYFAIPVGCGLGYIVGSETSRLLGGWQWGLRVTPFMGAIAVLLILFASKEPERGECEGRGHLEPTKWNDDLKSIVSNRSFLLSTLGFTCVTFVTGALAWWGPTFIHAGIQLQPDGKNVLLNDVSYKFGIIAMLSGLLGVPLGSFLAQRLRNRYQRADPILCAVGLLFSAPFIYGALLAARSNTILCYILVFIAELFLNLNWSVVADILLYVIIPTRRSMAEAFQILMSHAFGDAGSPYLIGVISEALKVALAPSGQTLDIDLTNNFTSIRSEVDDFELKFKSLQYALFITCFVEILGGCFFLWTAVYILRDKMRVEQIINGETMSQPKNLYADEPLINDISDQRRNLVS